MLQRTEGGEWEAVEGVSEARVARQVIFVETSKGCFTLHRPSSSVMPRPICSCSGTCCPGPRRPSTHVLSGQGPSHLPLERALLPYFHHVRCRSPKEYYCFPPPRHCDRARQSCPTRLSRPPALSYALVPRQRCPDHVPSCKCQWPP